MNKWTDKQLDVINTRNRNILVSAAAGSGKTAVLVQRIIEMITDPKNSINIDQLLVVTFTRAAAGEMKERVRQALEKIVEKDPQNLNASRQLSFIHNAHISTIDSFCSSVVKDNFDKIDLDPNFRIGDEIEIAMLKSDIIKEMLEEYYQAGSEEFMQLAEQYSAGKLNDNIEELINELYKKAQGNYNPEQWIDNCSRIYYSDTLEEFLNTDFMKTYESEIRKNLKDIQKNTEYGIGITNTDEKLEKARYQLENIKDKVTCALNADGLINLGKIVNTIEKERFYANGSDPAKKTMVKNVKDSAMVYITELQDNIFKGDLYSQFDDIKNARSSIEMIIKLTKDFMSRFKSEKADKGLIDFNDQSHLALNILNDIDEKGNLSPSQVAKQMSTQYKEIMIDEYQDSNFVQEAILGSISKGQGTNNMFMVGDVKQSIYRFRQAEPKLFLGKYDSYSENLTSDNCKIILDRNFRSRKEVIDSVNFIFNYIMNINVGGINYRKGNQLSLGADYNEIPEDQDNRTELVILEGEDKSIEAQFVAQKIKEITNPVTGMKITNKKGKYRPVEYKDIVILLRTLKGNSQIYVNQLEANGIPAYAQSNSGYYDSLEIKTLVSMLCIIDNPLQDIHLAGVMLSPMFNFTSEDLAVIRSEYPKEYLYSSIVMYNENGEKKSLLKETNNFLKILEMFRKRVSYTSVYEMINLVLETTGYDYYILSMTNGKRRLLNIESLKDKAVVYDSISYKGLFNFVRYIEKIEEMKKDDSEASEVSEKDNLVRITSIHKSKGLQYPVVFLCNTAGRSNVDKDKIVSDNNGNIGVEYIDNILKTKTTTLVKNIIKKNLKVEDKGEILRLLYVGLTRAEEKLFITGIVPKLENAVLDMGSGLYSSADIMPYMELCNSNTLLKILGSPIGKNKTFYEDNPITKTGYGIGNKEMYNEDSSIKVSFVYEDKVLINTEKDSIDEELKKQTIELLENANVEKETIDKLKDNFNFQYPFKEDVTTHSKASVTEIKKQNIDYDEEQDGYFSYKSHDNDIVPDFMKMDKENISLTGAQRGTAYHRVLELLAMDKDSYSVNDIENMVEEFVLKGLIEKTMADSVNPKKICTFTKSKLFHRMKMAYTNNDLYKERQFLMGRPVKNINKNSKSNETMIIQGIIDVCFKEDNQFVIVDYKTDFVNTMQELVDRYKIQLECYKEAIEQISGIKVKEMIIYSIYLDEEIQI